MLHHIFFALVKGNGFGCAVRAVQPTLADAGRKAQAAVQRNLLRQASGTACVTLEQCAGRLAAAVREISFAAQYDFIVINDEIETARQQLLCAIGAGKMLSRIQKNKIEEVLYHAQTCHD